MKIGARIVAELEAVEGKPDRMPDVYWLNKTTIHAALLAYDPPSPLRTILDSHVIEMNFSANEIAAARAELDRLEGK